MKKIIFFLILLLISASALQRDLHLVHEAKIYGFFPKIPEPQFWNLHKSTWLKSEYQTSLSSCLENHIGLRSFLFRIHNQYDFSLFGIIHAEGFIKGKNRHLFEEDYIGEYSGEFFIGAETINKKLQRLKEVRDTLLKNGTHLLMVFEPGKASVYPEYIPGRYRLGSGMTNYQYLTQNLNNYSIPFLDLNKMFISMKDTSRYALFPEYGMHWSIYGMATIADTLGRFVERESSKKLPRIRLGKLDFSDTARYTDNDIGVLLNILVPLKKSRYVYPEITATAPADPVKVLVIADSYYANIEQVIGERLFGKDTYWYYNSKVYPYVIDDDNPVYVNKQDLVSALKQFDVVMLMSSEINLHCMFWNFPDEAWLAFHPGEKDDPVYEMENKIRNSRGWFRNMVSKSKKQQRPLEQTIHDDAAFMVRN